MHGLEPKPAVGPVAVAPVVRNPGFNRGMTTLPPLVKPARRTRRDPTGGDAAREWRELVDQPPMYPRISIEADVAIPMSDGATIRTYICRPADERGTPVTGPFPTVINITPYNKQLVKAVDSLLTAPLLGPTLRKYSARLDFSGTRFEGITEITRVIAGGALDLFTINRHLVRSGYVQLIVDARGTGSSTGVWDILHEREQLDSIEIIDWVRTQAWCNGRIGMAGISYSAINALQAAGHRPEGLDAIFAVEGAEDILRELFATGGIPSAFIPMWLTTVNALKWVPSLAPHRGGIAWLRARMSSPATALIDLIRGYLTGDDYRLYDGTFFDAVGPLVEQIEVPTFLYGCWHDVFAGAGPNLYRRLRLRPGRKQLLMGDGYHANPGIGFGREGFPPRLDVLERAWFDRWLRDIPNGVDHYGPVTVRRQGSGWVAMNSYPAPYTRQRRLFLSATSSGSADHSRYDGSLVDSPDPLPATTLDVRPGWRAVFSRDTTQAFAGLPAMLGGPFSYDARFPERDAVTFSTPAVGNRTVISGGMNLRLNTVAHASETLWVVWLCDVAPDGSSRQLSDGALLATRRAIDEVHSEYAADGEFLAARQLLTRAAVLPVVPNVPTILEIPLFATDAVLEPGHRLRIDILAGAPPRFLPTLPDLARTRLARQTVLIDREQPSFLTLRATGSLGAPVTASEAAT